MTDLIFLADPGWLDLLENGDPPTDHFLCMNSQGFDMFIRIQLYALVMNVLREDAAVYEQLISSLSDEGPWIYQVNTDLVDTLAGLDEDDIIDYTGLLAECEEAIERGFGEAELVEYFYLLVHFCKNVEDDCHMYVYSG